MPARTGRGKRPVAVRLALDELRLSPHTVDRHPGVLALELPPGRWTPPVTLDQGLLLYIVSGAVLRDRRPLFDLLLERDLSQFQASGNERWKVVSQEPAVIALLPPPVVIGLAAVPGALEQVLVGVRRQHERNLELRAIVGTYDVEERIRRFFGLLVRHVGMRERDAIRVPLMLEQKRVEEILSAGHTQATAAFRTLVSSGHLVHDARGWLVASSVPNSDRPDFGSPPNPIFSTTSTPLAKRQSAA